MSRFTMTNGRWMLAAALAASFGSTLQAQNLLDLGPAATHGSIDLSLSPPAEGARFMFGVGVNSTAGILSSSAADPICCPALYLDDFGIGATTTNAYERMRLSVAQLVGNTSAGVNALCGNAGFWHVGQDGCGQRDIAVWHCDCPLACAESETTCPSSRCPGDAESAPQESHTSADDLLVEQIMSLSDELGSMRLSERFFEAGGEDEEAIRDQLAAEIRRLAAAQRDQAAPPTCSYVFCDNGSCESAACGTLACGSAEGDSCCSSQQADAMRFASRQLQQVADQLEDAGLYDQADQLYALSDEMRASARAAKQTLATNAPWECQPYGTCQSECVVEPYQAYVQGPAEFLMAAPPPCYSAPTPAYAPSVVPYAPQSSFVGAAPQLPPPPQCPPIVYAQPVCPQAACLDGLCPQQSACPQATCPFDAPQAPAGPYYAPPTPPESVDDSDALEQLRELRTALDALERRLSR